MATTTESEHKLTDSSAKRVDEYLATIGLTRGEIKHNLASLSALQGAHLTAIPFENIDIVGGRVPPVTASTSVEKVVGTRRGGWCFENNGAFSWLLSALGFRVRQFGAAVLRHGPNKVLNHLCLEVTLDDEAYLVDVGFGDSLTRPLRLVANGPQHDPAWKFELTESGEEMTLMKYDDQDVPQPQYRFRRTHLDIMEFAGTAQKLARDPASPFATKMFATRLLDGGPDRVTLLQDRVKIRKGGVWSETTVKEEEWDDVLEKWFGFRRL